MSGAARLTRVRRVCLALPEATEKVAWGEPTFRVAGRRVFAMYASAATHHGAGRDALWCAAPEGAQRALVEAAPERIFVPPYVGKGGWIGLDLALVSDLELAMLVQAGYRAVAPARLAALLDADG